MIKIKGLCKITLILGLMLLTGCGGQKIKYDNTYIAGQDFPYMYYGNTYEFGVSTVETKDAYYKLVDGFVYYIDKKSMDTTPLCGKADCMHDKETGKKRRECNAYTNSADGYLYQSGDAMYYMAEYYDEKNRTKKGLYRISMDGTKKDRICTIDDYIYCWIIHRGDVYYATDEKGEDGKEHNALKRFSLESNNHKVETVKVLNGVYNGMTDTLEAYGNYVYFYTVGFNKDIKSDLSKNWKKTVGDCWYCYNITTGEVKELFTEQRKNGETVKIVQHIRFWKDKLLTMFSYLDDKENEDKKNIYQYDLDGENKKKLMTVEDSMDCFCADNKYLYVYNTWRDAVADGKEEPQMIVYDENLKEVDRIGLPVGAYFHLSPGNENCFLSSQEDEDSIAIIYMEKSKIGSYHGKKMDAYSCYQTKRVKDDQYSTE